MIFSHSFKIFLFMACFAFFANKVFAITYNQYPAPGENLEYEGRNSERVQYKRRTEWFNNPRNISAFDPNPFDLPVYEEVKKREAGEDIEAHLKNVLGQLQNEQKKLISSSEKVTAKINRVKWKKKPIIPTIFALAFMAPGILLGTDMGRTFASNNSMAASQTMVFFAAGMGVFSATFGFYAYLIATGRFPETQDAVRPRFNRFHDYFHEEMLDEVAIAHAEADKIKTIVMDFIARNEPLKGADAEIRWNALSEKLDKLDEERPLTFFNRMELEDSSEIRDPDKYFTMLRIISQKLELAKKVNKLKMDFIEHALGTPEKIGKQIKGNSGCPSWLEDLGRAHVLSVR
ncbi:MAG: hypothetical protein JWQ35_1012 [Bacteriovoracaceae bacterium]|nr:hypothetical protein [Bacteriovoracaceae bacterium]